MNLDDDDTVDELPARPRQAIPAADRELLELAARALGAMRVEDVEGEAWVNLHFADSPTIYGWNPLIHSDDALILAVKIQLIKTLGWHKFYDTTLDPIAATCRAFTRAAAEIGKAMQ